MVNWINPFPILGWLDDIFYFYSNFRRNICLQTVVNNQNVGGRFSGVCVLLDSATSH